MKKNIAILSIKDLRKAPRIDREIKALSNDFNIQLIGEHHTAFKELNFYNLYTFRVFFTHFMEFSPSSNYVFNMCIMHGMTGLPKTDTL